MATSPNYSWPEPDNTDLVKNGALAMRTLGNAIDTTMATMTPKSTVTAKGSLIAATAASTPANLSVGNNGQTLIPDSTAAAGLKWSNNAPAGGLQRIGSATNLSGASTVTISGISNASRLWINIQGASTVNTAAYVAIRFNTDSGSNYSYAGVYTTNPSTTAPIFSIANDRYYIGKTSSNAADTFNYSVYLDDGFSAGICRLSGGGYFGGTLADTFTLTGGYYYATAQISSVSIVSSSGNFDAGTIEVWGA